MMRHVFPALFVAMNFGSIHGFAQTQPNRPNIVIILADDLGRADVGFNGGKEIKTPNIDMLAASGARLDQFYVQPVCSPTRAALMTGRYPMRHGLQVGVVRPWAQYGLPLDERTLPQALKEAGYATAIAGKWLPVDGNDAWPAIAEGKASPDREILINATPKSGAIRVGDWKLVLSGDVNTGEYDENPGKAGHSSIELYNLASDPYEKNNLAESHPGKVKDLRARYDRMAAQAIPPKIKPKAPDFKSPKIWGEQN